MTDDRELDPLTCLMPAELEDVAAAVEAGLDYGAAWHRALVNGSETMLLTVVERIKADAYAAGQAAGRRLDPLTGAGEHVRMVIRDAGGSACGRSHPADGIGRVCIRPEGHDGNA